MPLKEALSSSLLQEFPFELFGVEPEGLFALLADDPGKVGALIRAFLEIGRAYDVQVEQFLLAALRSYQQLHSNYFADLEAEAAAFRRARDWPESGPLAPSLLAQDPGRALGLRGGAGDLGASIRAWAICARCSSTARPAAAVRSTAGCCRGRRPSCWRARSATGTSASARAR